MAAADRFDRADLERALDFIDAARALDETEPAHAGRLLAALEGLLAGSGDPVDREREGAEALAELDRLLAGAGGEADGAALRDFLDPILERLIDALLDGPSGRLAVYGSLRPGEENHHYVSDLVGEWREGEVRGILHPAGEGRAYPAVVRDPAGDPVRVKLLESRALPARWERLDAFEAPGYRRVLAVVDTPDGPVVANLYVLADDPVSRPA